MTDWGTCDTCGAPYEVSSREGRCGDCGNCADHCEHRCACGAVGADDECQIPCLDVVNPLADALNLTERVMAGNGESLRACVDAWVHLDGWMKNGSHRASQPFRHAVDWVTINPRCGPGGNPPVRYPWPHDATCELGHDGDQNPAVALGWIPGEDRWGRVCSEAVVNYNSRIRFFLPSRFLWLSVEESTYGSVWPG